MNGLEHLAVAYLLILGRAAAFVSFLPLFGGRTIPRTIKIGVAAALSGMWFLQYGDEAMKLAESWRGAWAPVALGLVREVMFGAALGLVFSMVLHPARMAGAYVGQEMGLTMAMVADPDATTSNVVSQIFETLGMLLFLSLNAHLRMVEALAETFQWFPVGSSLSEYPTLALAELASGAHHDALRIIAPVAACMLLLTVALTLLMRAAPQINLLSVGLALRVLVGLLVTLAFLPVIVQVMSTLLEQAVESTASADWWR